MRIHTVAPILLSLLAGAAAAEVDNMQLPEAVRVPAGHVVKLETVGVGEIIYECQEKKGQPGTMEWTMLTPMATLYSRDKANLGKYYAGSTWEITDGSKVTGKPVATAPSPHEGSLPLQLIEADSNTGNGSLSGITYIQRLDTLGGAAPVVACDEAALGTRQPVPYRAEYIFYSAK